MIIRNKYHNIKKNLSLVSLFFFSCNFFNLGQIFLVLSFILTITPSFRLKNNKLILTFIMYTSFFTIGYVLNFGVRINYIVQYLVYPLMGAIIGQNMISSNETKDEELYKLFLVIILGLFLHGILNSIHHINSGNYLIHTEYLIDIWTKNNQSRISQGLFFTPVAVLLFFSVQYKTKLINKAIIFFAVSSLYYSILIGNRSIFIILFLSNFIDLILSGTLKEKIKSLLIVLCIFVIIMIVYNNNLFNLKDIFENSYFYKRVFLIEDSLLSTPRFQYFKLFIQKSGNFMFGREFSNFDLAIMPNYIHNNWLDTFYYTGFIPFLFFSWFTLIIVKDLIRSMRNQPSYYSRFRFLVIVAFLLQFMIEPVFLINPYYLVMFYVLIFSQNTISSTKNF